MVKDAYAREELQQDDIAECLALFVMSIKSTASRFDNFVKTGSGLSSQELLGMSLFDSKYQCASCHSSSGGYRGGGGFESGSNIGLDAVTKDKGIGAITNAISGMDGAFKVPNLHNVGITAPYMHDGRFKTLENVLDHYSKNIQAHPNLDERLKDADGKPMHMNISPAEKDAIIAFLNSMTDYELTTKSIYSNPFKTK